MPVFGAVDESALAPLEKDAREVSFAGGQIIFLQDQSSSHLYKVVSGAVRMYRALADGRRHVVGFALPGDFLGISTGDKHRFTAEALNPVVARCIDQDAFDLFVAQRPELLEKIFALAKSELVHVHQHMLAMGRGTARERVAWFLHETMQRSAGGDPAPRRIALPMTRQDIADYLGLTIETVSRSFTQLKRETIIDATPTSFTVKDRAKLAEIARQITT